MANDDFSEPPRRADSKNPIFFFSRFLGLGHLQGLGVRLGRIWGVLSLEPFLGGGGGPAGGLYRPSPPRKRKPGLPCGFGAVVQPLSSAMPCAICFSSSTLGLSVRVGVGESAVLWARMAHMSYLS